MKIDQDWLSLTAGPELDALVAEATGKISGIDFGVWYGHDWKLTPKGLVDYGAFKTLDYHEGPLCTRCGFGYCYFCDGNEHDRNCIVDPLPYSKDPDIAMSMLESQLSYEIFSSSTENLKRVTVTTHSGSKGVGVDSFLAVAACRAMIAAVEEK